MAASVTTGRALRYAGAPRAASYTKRWDTANRVLPLDSTAFQRPIEIVQRASHPGSSLETAFLRHLRKAVRRGGGFD